MGKVALTSLMQRGKQSPESYGPRWHGPGRTGDSEGVRRVQWQRLWFQNLVWDQHYIIFLYLLLPFILWETPAQSPNWNAVLHWFPIILERPIMTYNILYDLLLPTSPSLSLLVLYLALHAPATGPRFISLPGYVLLHLQTLVSFRHKGSFPVIIDFSWTCTLLVSWTSSVVLNHSCNFTLIGMIF